MEDRNFESIIANSMKIGTIRTLKELGLLPEVVTISRAEKIYGKRLIKEWRAKEWIKFYPGKTEKKRRHYIKLSELEIASTMMDLQNKIPGNILQQLM